MTARPEPEYSGDGSTFEERLIRDEAAVEPEAGPDPAPGAGSGPSPEASTGRVGQDEPEAGGSGDSNGEAAEAAILTDFVALERERDEYLAALQRLQADFENYRKRVLRQQEEQSARAALHLVGKLLPVLDALDLAQTHLDLGDLENLSAEAQALVQARALLFDALEKEGLERVDGAGVPFDPQVHDAVAHQPVDASEPEGEDGTGAHEATVDEVLRAGYRWRGQVLRPAMVRVRG